MPKVNKGCRGCLLALFVPLAVLLFCGIFFVRSIAPSARGGMQYVRYKRTVRLNAVLTDLEKRGVIQNAWTAEIVGRMKRAPRTIAPGTYSLLPGESLVQVFARLKSPLRQIVVMPEGWWIRRYAQRLQREEVCSADDFLAACLAYRELEPLSPSFPNKNLEGRLFPDSYNFPPLTEAKEVIEMQLRAFKKKAWPLLQTSSNPQRVLTVASLVELEAATDKDRGLIAGVIENRVKAGMPLQIDATVLYALQEWKQLPPGVVRTVDSPYNTYLHKGLPPGPIGSPGLKSIIAALKPTQSGYLYYVARPNRSHFFATNYPDHLKNIKLARAEARGVTNP